MTPKEKAKELFEKYLTPNLVNPLYGSLSYEDAKQCAIIAVNEVLSISYFDPDYMTENDSFYKNYWILVKTEIEQL